MILLYKGVVLSEPKFTSVTFVPYDG